MCKMWHSVYFFSFLFLSQAYINLANVHPYIVSINLRLKEEQIPRLVADSLFGNNPALAPYFDYSHVSLDDFEELIASTTRITLKETLRTLNVDSNDFYYMLDRNTLVNVITTAKINLHHVYSMFLQFFIQNPIANIPKILNSLHINNEKFTVAVVFGTDSDLLEALLEGSYSKKNIEKALQFVNQEVTLREALSFLKASKLDLSKLKESNASHLITELRDLSTSDDVVNLMYALNVSAGDFYRNQAFNVVLNDLTDTGEVLIGSLVSPVKIITLSYTKTLVDYEILKNYTELVARAVENHGVQHVIVDTTIPEHLSIVPLVAAREFNLNIYLKYSLSFDDDNLKNCAYMSISSVDNSISAIRVTVKLRKYGILVINKTEGMEFNVGSPLICSEYLYGVAYWDYDNKISFYKIAYEEKHNSTDPPKGYISTAVDFVKQLPWLVVEQTCALLKYINLNVCSDV